MLTLSAKVTLCLLTLSSWTVESSSHGVGDASRVIERARVRVMSMVRISVNHVLKWSFSFTGMSAFSYTDSKVNVPLASLGLFVTNLLFCHLPFSRD